MINVQSLALLCLLILTVFASLIKADQQKLPVPRFAVIKFSEVNAKTGPASKCPIEWVFIKPGEPVEIIAEYEQWRRIRDVKSEGGWVHLSLLSSKRAVVMISPSPLPLTKAPNNCGKIVAIVTPQVRCQLNKCQQHCCQVRCQNYTGWLPKEALWGVYPHERL